MFTILNFKPVLTNEPRVSDSQITMFALVVNIVNGLGFWSLTLLSTIFQYRRSKFY
jgi:hypothetical protein